MNKINHLSILGLTFSRACSHSTKLKQVWLCSRLLAALAVLYVVTVFATAFLGYLSPYAWVFFPAIAALLGAFSYYSAAVRWQKYQGAAEELGIDYAKGLMTFASPWGLIAVVLTTAIAGFVGIQFAAKVIKSGKI